MAFAGPGNQAGGFQWIMIVFPICHVAVGVGLTYYVIAGFLNKTEILVTHDSVHVRHRPVPWWGNRSVPRHEIQEVETEFVGMSTQPTYTTAMQMTVSVHHDTGDQIVLLQSLPQRQAEYIAWHLADYLAVPLVRKSEFNITAGIQRLPGWVQRMLPGGHRTE